MSLKTYISGKIKGYFADKSKFSIITDFVFIVLLVLMLIPSTRKEIIIGVRKLTMKQPVQASAKDIFIMNDTDYNWSYQTSEGEVIDFRTHKNKVVFLNFWSTRCPHCIAELRSIENLYNTYKNKLEFVLLTHEKPSHVKQFLKKENYNIPFYLTFGYVPEVFESRFIPSTFIISKEGKIVVKKTGPAKWDGKDIKALLNELLK